MDDGRIKELGAEYVPKPACAELEKKNLLEGCVASRSTWTQEYWCDNICEGMIFKIVYNQYGACKYRLTSVQ